MTVLNNITSALQAIVGEDRVLTSLEERTFYSTDMSKVGEIVEAVVRVENAEELSKVVSTCTANDRIVIPRGGGFSYTGGYLPVSEQTVTVDLRGLNRVLEINTEDMYVVVETGVTWERLYEALKAKGVRTPYFGPMSGYNATVGGALSQGSIFLGSTQYGTVADSVLALEVVLADGTILKTGSWSSTIGTKPFFRNYGPDMTGVFLSDTGALGFKTKAVLKLIPFPPFQQYGSFAFDEELTAVKALSEVGRAGLAAECYLWDPYFVHQMSKNSTGLAEDLKYLTGVATGGSSVIKGLINAAKIAIAGKRVFSKNIFILNIVVDDVTDAGANGRINAIRAIVDKNDGREIPASAPMALRGTPFTNFNVEERRLKLRNLPTNSFSPHSKIAEVVVAVRGLFAKNKDLLERNKIEVGCIYFAVSNQAVTFEPLFYWEDEEHFLHNRIAERTDVDSLKRFSDRPEATKVAVALRKELSGVFKEHGCVHVQIGKSYPYLETREPATAALLTAIKKAVDPNNMVNRGSLGLTK